MYCRTTTGGNCLLFIDFSITKPIRAMNKRHLMHFFLLLLLAGGWFEQAAAQCISNAGFVNPGNVEICSNNSFFVSNQGSVKDSSDIKLYIVHDGSPTQIGNILFSSPFPAIFPYPPAMSFGVAYQVAVVVGNSLGGGQIDLNDPCLSIAGGITLTLSSAPELLVDASGPLTCNGPGVTLTTEVAPTGQAYTYQWFGPNGFSSVQSNVTVNQKGEYYVEVTNVTSGCSIFDTILVQGDNTIPTASIAVSNVQCSEATFTANTNNPLNTYTWSNNIANPAIVVDQSGTYCVTVTSPQGCIASACRSFNAGNPLGVGVQSFGNNICTDSLGLWAVVQGGTPPFTYAWSTGEITAVVAPINAGIYCVTVADANGCTVSECFFLEDDEDDCGTLEGKVFADYNTDCVLNSGDVGLKQFTLRIENAAGDVYYVYSNADGDYSVQLPPGDYTVSPVLVNSPWAPCQASYTVTVPFAAPVTQNVPLQAEEQCASLTVDVGNNFLRRCIGNNHYAVQYCNQGTVAATDAYVEVVLDAFMTLETASIPHVDLGNNVYRFDIGTININDCGDFWFKVVINCDAVLGQTHCVEATIFPNAPCPAPNPDWSGASVHLTGECTGSELVFRAQNVGAANMTAPLEYVIIEDAVMMLMPPGNPLLAGEERIVFTAPANGSTWRLEAEQEPLHPGMSMPALSVEGCTTGQVFSLGFVTQFANDDADPWVDIDCRENVGSYDPNDKQGFPTGYGSTHYIRPGTDIEYLIRFQNTGTDTAFAVVIRDTLSPWLDPGTVVPGASSHPYRFNYYGDGFLKFEFDPIALPDSNVNVAGSQGFVSFRVSQKTGVPLETDILNTASIYFDANLPVLTNQTQHRVGENFVLVSTWTPLVAGLQLRVMPNPATDYAVVQLSGLETGDEWQIELLDATGRSVLRDVSADQQWRLDRGALPAGLYVLRVYSGGRVLGTGKVVLR